MAKKKVSVTGFDERRKMIETNLESISIYRQCELLDLSRTAHYYEAKEDAYTLRLMRLIDEQYTRVPYYGVLRMTAWLRREGHAVNEKRVRRLMRQMGLCAIYPKPHLSQASPAHKKYPYLLRGVAITQPDQVWSTDITYIRLKHGFVYLVAIIDWYSRYVLSWEVSTTLETGFCVDVLHRALAGKAPEIFNTDQGVQFTSEVFTGVLLAAGIQISMDGRGRALDNVFVERLWRSVKYEEVYLNDYSTVREAKEGLSRYFQFYNTERLHQSLNYATPAEVYYKNQSLKKVERKFLSTEIEKDNFQKNENNWMTKQAVLIH